MKISKAIHFVLIMHLILEKVTTFLVKKRLSTSEVISQKPHGEGGGGTHPQLVQFGLTKEFCKSGSESHHHLTLFGLGFSQLKKIWGGGQNAPF